MNTEINALIVNQWLKEWESVKFDKGERRTRPDSKFFMFMLSAKNLKKLSDIHRRSADKPRVADTGIQRKFISERSEEISEFIKGGFPWSILSKAKRNSQEFEDLRMPGWLPTAIIANIKAPGTIRAGKELKKQNAIQVDVKSGIAKIILPEDFENDNWDPESKPLEIIDGQHRLLAFNENLNLDGDFELPVVAFYDLDITWQAYLFYVINIKPKKINTSLAYDLYPILRVQDWLEKSPEGAMVYRETRAQELTEILWSHDASPWKNRINMLGDSKKAPVTQASFIRSLINSFIKSWGGPNTKVGGLFGGKIDSIDNDILYWSRTQQGAFLILIWQKVAKAVQNCEDKWAQLLRVDFQKKIDINEYAEHLDGAFLSEFSLLATDQGVRGILQVSNDLCYVGAKRLNLIDWDYSYASDELNLNEVSLALKTLENHKVSKFFEDVFEVLVKFDWRTSSAPGLDEQTRINQMAFRGSGGYKELRHQLLARLRDSNIDEVAVIAKEIMNFLGYN
jgi:DGQHR domain-containing protein